MMAGLHMVALPLAAVLAGATQQAAVPVDDDLAAAIVALREERGGRMTVPVSIGGAGPYDFVIDTGAERTVISRELAGNLRLAAGRQVNVVAMSGKSRVGTYVIPAIRVSSVPGIGAIHAPALEAAHLGGLGLVGIDMLRDHVVTIDFDGRTMSVTPAVRRTRKDARPARDEIVVRAKSMLGQLIVTDAQFDGVPIRVVIDTGSSISVGNSAMRRLVQRRTVGRFRPLEMISVTGERVPTDYIRVDNIGVGDMRFHEMPVAFADVAPFVQFGLDDRPAMLLGMQSLRSFRRVRIDFANREVRFQMPRG
ncbi:retroviral-like aspartic protease family protein [Sphingomonas sp.]|uniref:retroviral-like aspartic protease family protein n=1 Tax=Sphingomonas sp. TaxID=28214 RepID=UPI002C133421|nr:retroviral-like aspartic protease family protein [Sphingomonas sp.]HWK36835.1 retroviral-like aspartic protease family protein [Sphingomonas sp.]